MPDGRDRPGRRVAWVTGASRGVGRGVLQFAAQLDLTRSQPPEGVGRAIVALAGDPERLGLTGRALAVEALATRYGLDVRA